MRQIEDMTSSILRNNRQNIRAKANGKSKAAKLSGQSIVWSLSCNSNNSVQVLVILGQSILPLLMLASARHGEAEQIIRGSYLDSQGHLEPPDIDISL